MATSLVFSVTRSEPVLVSPAKSTPYEFKYLSDIDDQESLRFQIPIIQFYRNNPSLGGRDPARVIRDAIAEALVFYYPFAGRIREGLNRKLMVECTGEGAVFIEADADVSLKEFGDALQPPFPCFEELLYDVPGTGDVINCPLLLIQVTRLTCGGFIFALRLNHTMSDASGIVQFMTAVGELAHGARAISVLPVWKRELLNARDPPCVTFVHREYGQLADMKSDILPSDDIVHRSFFFGPAQISGLRKQVPNHLRTCSTFELLTACIWRCRTIALALDPDDEVRFICVVNVRGKYRPPLPTGYYGNVIAFPVAISPAGKLCNSPLGYALELVKKAKNEVTQEYMQSVADLMVLKGRPRHMKTKEEMEKLKEKAQVNKDHMLQVVWIFYLDLLSDILKAEVDKLKKSLDDEIHILKERVSKLESDLMSKSTEVTYVVSRKEEALSSYDRLSKMMHCLFRNVNVGCIV